MLNNNQHTLIWRHWAHWYWAHWVLVKSWARTLAKAMDMTADVIPSIQAVQQSRWNQTAHQNMRQSKNGKWHPVNSSLFSHMRLEPLHCLTIESNKGTRFLQGYLTHAVKRQNKCEQYIMVNEQVLTGNENKSEVHEKCKLY